MAGPSLRDVKRLFALSSNRCAFPKCPVSIAEGNSLVGEICHIKGDRPGAARYDALQSDEQRQAFENLILMCATHHKVVDDDEDAYTVERLRMMKTNHESRSIPLTETNDEEAIAKLLIAHSVVVTNQSGGLAAHTVNAQTINIHAAASNSKFADTADVLWLTLTQLKAKFSMVALIDTIMLPSELDEYLRGDSDAYQIADCLGDLRDHLHVPREMAAILPKNGEMHRLYASPRLWAIYQAYVALIARSAMLITLSYKQSSLHEWRKDTLIDQHLRTVLPGPTVDAQKAKETGGLQRLFNLLDQAFLEEARKVQR